MFYFATTQSPTVRRIDLLRHQHMHMLNATMNLVKKGILLSFSNQKEDYTLYFNQ